MYYLFASKKKLLFFLFIISIFFTANAQTLPAGFYTTQVASDWTQPVGAAFNASGTKLFVWEKAGKVFVCNWNTVTLQYEKQVTPILDISEEVGDWRDHGLLGFALDPNFEVNGKIYVMYIVDRHHLINFGTANYDPSANDYFSATIGRVTRYTTEIVGGEILAIPSSRTILIGETKSTGIPVLHESHVGGTIVFAEDGTLIVSTGDGASYESVDIGSDPTTYYAQGLADGIIRPEENVGAFRCQMLNSFSGKILRINPLTGDGLSSNPFYQSTNPRSPQSRVWSLGLRNPFRFTIKEGTGSNNPLAGDIGELYISDVGWGTYEKLEIIKNPGVNCGWPIFEGITSMDGGYIDDANTTENKDEPNPLFGINGCTKQYFTFADLIKQATADNNITVYNPCELTTPIVNGNPLRNVHHIPVMDWRHHDDGIPDSARVAIFNNNILEVAQIGTPESGVVGTPFSGPSAVGGCLYTGNLYPPEYQNTFFQPDLEGRWLRSFAINNAGQVTGVSDFATGLDDIVGIVQNPMDGSLIMVMVSDASFGPGSIQKLNYGGNLPPVVKMSSDVNYGPSALTVNFTGSNSYDPENTTLTYSWDFGDVSSGANNTSFTDNPSHTFIAPNSSPIKYKVTLTVTDAGGANSTDSLFISVNNTPPLVNITSPIKDSYYKLGSDTLYALTAEVTDAEHSNGELSYKWQTFLRHNSHQHGEPIDTNRISTTNISRIGCNGDTYYWFIKLIVTDAAGLSTTDSSKIFPDCSGTALPVTLLDISVTQQNNTNKVTWTTSSEINLKWFDIERSYDGINFNRIGTVEAMRQAGVGNYNFKDDNHLVGYNYYRLKMIDFNGTFKYSTIVKVFTGEVKSNELMISPNPVANDFINIGIKFTQIETVTVRLLNINGATVKSKTETTKIGFNTFTFNQLSYLNAGIYIVEVIYSGGKKIGKVVITK